MVLGDLVNGVWSWLVQPHTLAAWRAQRWKPCSFHYTGRQVRGRAAEAEGTSREVRIEPRPGASISHTSLHVASLFCWIVAGSGWKVPRGACADDRS